MTRRRRYTAVRREGLRVVSRLLREAVWGMTGPEDHGRVLTTLTEGFDALRIPYDGCGIYVIDGDTEPAGVVGQYLRIDGRWRQSLPARDRDAAIAVWQEGAATYTVDVREDAPDLDGALFLRFGTEVRSVVDVPFVNGVLTVTSRQVDGFSGRDIEMLRELAEALPPLFYRTEDLRQLEIRDRQVEYAQRLEMVGQLAAGTAHEVNNSLMVVLGQCQLLLMDQLEPGARESLELMLKSVESTKALVSRILELARGHEPQRQTTDLNQLVRESLHLVRRQLARDHVELLEQLASDVPLVHVQSGQIQQVLLNLVQNARDAVGTSGDGHGRIVVRTWHMDGIVRLSVEDDGPGVDASKRERIFEPFYTTKATGKGTGLGLSVCRTIATGHGGDLRVESSAQGACFVLQLPAADAAVRKALN